MNIPDLLLAASLFLLVFVATAIFLLTEQLERDRLHREALIRRIKGEDTRPDMPKLMPFEQAPLPWNHTAWAHLDGEKRA
jgi:hypothetical protein